MKFQVVTYTNKLCNAILQLKTVNNKLFKYTTLSISETFWLSRIKLLPAYYQPHPPLLENFLLMEYLLFVSMNQLMG